jgi:tetratricopeptide (TPR) repeat protein
MFLKTTFLIVAVTIGVSTIAVPVAAQPTSSRILVVPFDNAQGEPRYHWLSEAAAVLLSDSFRNRGLAAIVRPERVRAFEQLNLPVAASLSRATVIKVGQLVGAGHVIVGSFRVEGSALAVRARGIRLDVGRLEPELTERGELTELFGIFDRLGRRLQATSATPAAAAGQSVPLDAFENYIKGLVAETPVSQATFLEAALDDYPAFDRARLALWEARTEQGDHTAALAAVRAVPADSSSSRRARFCAGVSLVELKRYDEAVGMFKTLLETASETTSDHVVATGALLNNLGVVLIRRGSTPQTGPATYYLTKATDTDPDPDYMFNLGYAYAMERNHQGALYWLREALRRDPTDVDAHFVLALTLQATGSGVEATRERELARQLSSRYAELDRRTAESKTLVPPGLERLRMEAGSSPGVRADKTIVNSAHREQRELAAFHLDQGRRFFEREQDREAMAELKRAVYLSPYEAQAHLLIGRIHLRAGRPADAIDAFKISIWSEDRAPAHVFLGAAYLKTGDAPAAKAEAQRALALDPGSAEAKKLLTEIK